MPKSHKLAHIVSLLSLHCSFTSAIVTFGVIKIVYPFLYYFTLDMSGDD